jgi:flagellar biosynthesis/type III secretory pathway chaperone
MPEVHFLEMMQTEIELLGKLNELSLIKKEALLNENIARLEEVVFQEESSIRQLKTLDDACASQVQFFFQAHETDTAVTEVFWEKQNELRQVAAKLQANNRFNMDLIRDSLAITQFMLNALTAPAGHKVLTYNASGKTVDPKAKNHLLDYKG